MKTIITWLKRAAMLSVTVAFAAEGFGANAATSLTLNDGDTLTGVYEDYEITIAAGATVTFNGATITHTSGDGRATIECAGDATIVLAEGSVNGVSNTVDSCAAIHPATNATLTIRGSGSLDAYSSGDYGAGIGAASARSNANPYPCGNIVIEGGTITAQGGSCGAGVGAAAWSSPCGDITITGNAVVTASSGQYAAAIGAASDSSPCGNITISGNASVTARKDAYQDAAGIGACHSSPCGNIVIDTTGTVDAKGSYSAAIGASYESTGTCGDITIRNGTIFADGGDRCSGIGATFAAESGSILISGGTITAEGETDGAGIGARGATSFITISGGVIDARGGASGAGIGSCNNSTCGDITITEGITRVVALKGMSANASVGAGGGSATVGTVTISSQLVRYDYMDGMLVVLTQGGTEQITPVLTTGGAADWYVEDEEGLQPGAWRSGAIGDLTNTWLKIAVSKPCDVFFRWKVSSESGYDCLRLYLNGVELEKISGNQDWAICSVTIDSSLDDLRLSYGKDRSTARDSDCGWVKDISIVPFDGTVRTVTVDSNCQDVNSYNVYVVDGYTFKTMPPIARYGYAFLGLFTAAEGGEQVTAPCAVTANTTFYAHWVKTLDFEATGSKHNDADALDPSDDVGWQVEDDGITWHSGAIGDSTNSWARFTLKRPGTLSFKWKVSSEINSDYLRFYVDGVEQTNISGNVDWADVSWTSDDARNHVVEFRYTKDGGKIVGLDCGWVKDVVFTPFEDVLAVNLDLNYDGADAVEPRYVKRGNAFDVDEIPDIPRTGYALLGWFTDAVGGEQVTAIGAVTADANLYARWVKTGVFEYTMDNTNHKGSLNWTLFEKPQDGFEAGTWRTGPIGDNQETWIETSVTGPCTVFFKWKVSSEGGFDFLRFYVGEEQKAETSGDKTNQWEMVSCEIAESGSHVVKWLYHKDGSTVRGLDCGWVKDIVVTHGGNPYTVTWMNGSVAVETDANVEPGDTPSYDSAQPTQAATAQYYYDFAGWDPELELVSSNTAYTAVYTATLRSYDVTWVDENGTALDAQTLYYGTTPEYAGETPTKAATPKYTYTFAGWTPEVAEVTGVATYTAKYDATVNKYTITWKNDDGTVIDSADVAYDETPTHADPTKASTAQYHYEFAGWSPSVESVIGEATYTATYNSILRSYTITWKNDAGAVIDTTTVNYGDTPSHAAPTKASTAQYDYTFAGWGDVVAVSGEATYQATFTPVLRSYTVSWVVEGETVASGLVAYGTTPAYSGVTPTKAETAEYTYTFAGWSPTVSTVTGEATYTAQFNSTKRSYTITWANIDGAGASATSTVEYGATPAYGGVTPTKAEDAEYTYTFAGWSPTVSTVTGEATYTAQFEATSKEPEDEFAGYVKIGDVAGFEAIANNLATNYVLMADIDLQNVERQPFGEFSGILDGNGYAIRNINITGAASNISGTGLFQALRGATVRNLTLENGTVESTNTGEDATGGLAGHVYDSATIEDCTVDLEVKGYQYVGGIVGYARWYGSMTIRRCRSFADVTGTYCYVGGLLGNAFQMDVLVEDSYSCGMVTANSNYAGGLVGYKYQGTLAINNCFQKSIVTPNANNDRKLVGNGDGNATITGNPTIIDTLPKGGVRLVVTGGGSGTAAYVNDEIVATPAVGSFYAGYIGMIPEGAFNDVTVWAVFGKEIATVGEFNAITNNLAGVYKLTADIDLQNVERQPFGEFSGVFDGNGYAIKNISITKGSDTNIGLFSLLNGATIRNLTIDGGRIEGYDNAGGIAGKILGDTLIENCSVNLEVFGNRYTIGGFVGYADGGNVTFRRCRSLADVTSMSGESGGLVGATNSDNLRFEDCYAEGILVARNQAYCGGSTGYSGGLVGLKDNGGSLTISNCYHRATMVDNGFNDRQLVGNGDDKATITGVPSADADLTSGVPFAGWDTDVWKFTEGLYPRLRAFIPKYTVTWLDEDGETILDEAQFDEFDTPVYGGATPAKAATAQYTYTFAGWAPAVAAVESNTTYTATFDATLRSYTVTWKNDDGSTIDTTTVAYGTTPTHAAPTKAETAEYTYEFAGWAPAVAAVTGDTVYTATFNAMPKSESGTIDISTLAKGDVVQNGSVLTGTAPNLYLKIADGATITLDGASITSSEYAVGAIHCLGDATIILAPGSENTVRGAVARYCIGNAIYVPTNSTLTIRGSGSLYADSSNSEFRSAAIGAFAYPYNSDYVFPCGDIVIEGGTIVANGGVGIGASGNGGYCGNITITGDANVTATATVDGSAGIGAAGSDGNCGNITISGNASVTATGKYNGPGIGAADHSTCGDIVISTKGTVTATGNFYAPGIGAPGAWEVCKCGDITITGGTVIAAGSNHSPGIGTDYYYKRNGACGSITIADTITMVTAQGMDDSPGIYTASPSEFTYGSHLRLVTSDENRCYTLTPVSGDPEGVVDLSTLTGNYTAQNGDTLTGATGYEITIAAGATVTLDGVDIACTSGSDPAVTCLGDATIILAEGSANSIDGSATSYAGIFIYSPGSDTTNTLTIAGTGALTVLGGDKSAGIGSNAYNNSGSAGNIVISGGTVTATGGEWAAGIGSGYRGTCGDITITGGTVTANIDTTTSDRYTDTAALGAGCRGECGNILISGGTVTAISINPQSSNFYDRSCAIGATYSNGRCGNITITDGITSVTATKGATAQQHIGQGDGDATIGTVTISPRLAKTLTNNNLTLTLTPQDVPETVTVAWKNDDGTTIETDTVAYGATPTYDGDTPTKAADAQYTYTFEGWTPAVGAATSNTTYTATFSWTLRFYTVSWVVEGVTVASGTVEYGQTPEYGGDTPAKASTAEYSYEFTGWSPAIAAVTDDATYTAQFSQTKRSYTVSWVVEGMTVASGTVEYGATPVYGGDTPTKESTAEYSYAFTGWSPAVAAVTGDATYTAQFSQTKRSYMVSWVVEGMTVASGTVEYGQTPAYGGDTPTKESTAEYSYEFSGWSPTISAVTGEATYTAQFEATKRSYTVSWVVEGVTVASGTVEYDQTPEYGGDTPAKASTAEYSYEFTGWSPAIAAVTDDATYTAQFSQTKRSYTVSWVVEGVTVASGSVEYGQTPIYGGETPTKESTAEYSYEFTGWTPVVAAVTGDATYTAQFNATKLSYTVSWVVEGVTVASGTVEYGQTSVYSGATPTKPEDENYTYTFNGWTPAIAAVTGNATYTATFTATPKDPENPDEPYEGTETIDGIEWNYTVANGEATITGADPSDCDLVIPASVNDGIPVTVIGNEAFWCSDITSVVIPNSVTNICPDAFNDCGYLTNVVIGSGVVTIGGCVGQKTSIYDDPDEYIYTGAAPAFGACSSLMDFTLAEGNPVFEEIDGALYYRNTPSGAKTLALYPSGRSTLYFADGLTVTKIGDGACAWCQNFTALTIPGSVREIGAGSFDFTWMTSVVIPNSVTNICDGAFRNNGELLAVEVPGSVKKIGNGAFYHNISLTTLVLDEGIETIGSRAFEVCWSLNGEIVIPYGVTSIGRSAFSGAYEVDALSLPDTLTFIGADAFGFCESIQRLVVPLSVEEIEIAEPGDDYVSGAFAYCSGLAEIYMPRSLKPATEGATQAYLAEVFEGVTTNNTDAERLAEILTWYSDYGEIDGGDEPETYTITWVNWDGTTLETDENVAAGATPSYDGATPTKAETAEYTYTFSGWTPSVASVIGNATYTATFDATPKEPIEEQGEKWWMAVDLRTGATSYFDYDFDTATNTFNTTEYKTVKMAFRKVPRGKYFVQEGLKTATMAKDFYIALFETTAAQYQLMLDPSADVTGVSTDAKSGVSWIDLRGTTDVTPQGYVENGWNPVIYKLNQLTGLKFDLPTVAMWEVASLAKPTNATATASWPWFFGPTIDALEEYAWTENNRTEGCPLPVGMFKPNEWGLYDVYGNVWEWCADGVGFDWSDPSQTLLDTWEWSQTPNGIKRDYHSDYRRFVGGAAWSSTNCCNSVYIDAALRAGVYYSLIGFRLALIVDDGDGLPDYLTTGGSAKWYAEGDDGVEPGAWRSGAIGNRKTTWIETTVTGPCIVSFQWKVSSEERDDKLHMTVDDEEYEPISGFTDWANVSITLRDTGSHTIRWTYVKYSGTSCGEDCGWVKDFTVTPKEPENPDDPDEPYDGTETMNGIEWSYTVANGEATITGMSALSGDVVIPATVAGGVPVTAIADYMDYRLRYNEDITSVTIPASVTNIGAGNFVGCTALGAINVAEGNASYSSADGILYNAGQTELLVSPGGKTVVTNMPESVVEIASGAFEGSRVQFCVMAQYATNIAERAFSGCSYLGSVSIEKHIRNIGAYAFENCGNIRVVNFASDSECEVIGVGAFSGCEKLQKVIIPDSVIVIRGGAFSGCPELFDVTIGSGVAQIGDATVPHYIDEWGDDATMDFDPAFGNCANLRDFKVSKDNAIYEAIDGCIYYRSTPNTAKTLAVYPSGRGDLHFYGGVTVTAIGEGACSCCNKLKKLTIPQSVKDIGIEAFAHCEGVTNVYIQANSVTNISFGAFAWNMNTMDVQVSGSVKTIGEWAFMHNFGPYNLNDDFTTGQLVLHEGIREIGRGAFERCFRIGEIEIPRSVQRMGESAFADTRLARRIVIGNGLRVIPESAFECSWGSKLSELIIGNNVVGIGACAFSGCEKLRNLNIPSAVWDIGDNAFSGCTSLCALNLPSNLKSIGAGAFGGSSYGMMMSSARSLLGIGAQTFDGCTDLRRVLVPNSVTNIGVGAFGAVTSENLDRIYLPSSLKSADDSNTLAFLADQFPGLNLGIGDVTWYDDESELNYVTVTFNPNNGGETESVQVLDYLDSFPVPVTNGYAFAGWWTTSDDSGEKIEMSQHFAADTTLYAHWIETSVTFGEDAPWTAVYDDYHDEMVLQSGDVAFGYTSSASMTVTGPCIVGFDFMNYMDEWGTSNDLMILVDGEEVDCRGIFDWTERTVEIAEVGEHVVTWSYVNLNGSFNDYARLRNFSATPAVAHTVTFNLEGGTMAEATSRQVLRSLGALPIPVKAGYIFNGWWWTDGDGFAERVSTDFAVEDDVELVARWEKSPFSAVGGDASWFLDENGDYRTEAIGKDATVWAELSFKGPANISFDYKASMSWMSDDHFEFVVDGERALYQGGISSWRSHSEAFSDDAEHVVRWVVRRNDYGEEDYEAENCAWLTRLNLPEAITAAETPPVEVDDTKMEEPVDNGDGTRTIAAKEGETLTQSDVASVTVASPVDPAIDITAAYTKTLVDNTIVLQLATPEVEPVAEEENKEAEDATGLLEDVAKVDDEKIAAMPEPDVSDPDPEKHEEVGALPIKMYPGLYYQASWGDDLNNLTPGAKFRADGVQTHIGVIKQTGTRGFYKISVSER